MNKKAVLMIFLILFLISGFLIATPLISILLLTPNKLQRISFTINGFKIDDFAYWLQDIDNETVRNSKYDLMIIDYSSNSNETGEFSAQDINYMKSSGDARKLLIAYISIGEAENYRFYWNESWVKNNDGFPDAGAPSWLDVENPEWSGNYKVKFWMIEWQHVIFQYLDRIINASFDGIYMDIIDAYEYYENITSHSDWKMINFVANISNYVKSTVSSNFIVFVQNADELLKNNTYINCIDGIGREDLFYMDNSPTSKVEQENAISNLNLARSINKTVLIIDYPQSYSLKLDFYKKCIANGFIPYAADRELNSLKEYDFYPPT